MFELSTWINLIIWKTIERREKIILIKVSLANFVRYGQAGKHIEWLRQIKKDFYKESKHIYNGALQTIDRLIWEKQKLLNKIYFEAKCGFSLREYKFTQTLDDWIEIYKMDGTEIKPKKKN